MVEGVVDSNFSLNAVLIKCYDDFTGIAMTFYVVYSLNHKNLEDENHVQSL